MFSVVIQVPSQNSFADPVFIVDLRLLNPKFAQKVIFVLRVPIPSTHPNNCECMKVLEKKKLT